MTALPVTLLCGFLGSGKTTRINHLIRRGTLEDALFLVNDFGQINIDAELIESRDDAIVRLNNGCACCGIAGNVCAQLRDIRRWPHRPAQLVFEASGIARPRPLMQLLDTAQGYRLEHSESLVDASAFERHYHDAVVNDVVAAQIREVSHLRINRADWLTDADRDALLRRIGRLNPSAHIVVEEAGQPPPAGPPTQLSRRGDGALVTESLSLNRPIDVDGLESLLAAAASDVVRAKGLVQANDSAGTHYVIQFAGGRTSRTATRAGRCRALVVIGHDGEALSTLLAAVRRL